MKIGKSIDAHAAPRAAGFTIIELMITILIASIMVALAAPGMKELMERNRVQTAADTLFTSLMLARSESLKRNQPVVMCKTTDQATCSASASVYWEQGWLVYADADGDSAPDPNEILRVVEPMRNGDTVRVSGAFTNSLSYRTDGSASGTGTFVLCNAEGDTSFAREVDVSVTGRPRLNKTTADCTP